MKLALKLALLLVFVALGFLALRIVFGGISGRGRVQVETKEPASSFRGEATSVAETLEVPESPAETRSAGPVVQSTVRANPRVRAAAEMDVVSEAESDQIVWGRLVDAETGQPLAGHVRLEASLGFRGSREVDVPTGADGAFELRVRSLAHGFASAAADGHARVIFALDQGHETRARALDVLLLRTATLEVVVRELAQPSSGVHVGLSTDAYRLLQDATRLKNFVAENPSWSSTTDANGSAVLLELPPRVPLELVVTAGGREPRSELEPLVFEPGERRRIEIAVDPGATIIGRVLDGYGRAVAGREIVLTQDRVFDMIEWFQTPQATARTDDDGRFRFDDVASGDWFVGPPLPEPEYLTREDVPDVPIGLAQAVRVEEGASLLEVLLRVDQGMYLRGRVLDSDGTPAAQCSVGVFATEPPHPYHSRTDEAGRFSFGPLPAGTYSLMAGVLGSGFPQTDPVLVTAGDTSIELRLPASGTIRARIVDVDGQLQSAESQIVPFGEEYGTWCASPDGTLETRGLLPGPYTIHARTSAGLCGRASGVLVRAGEATESVDIVVRPGARLKLSHAARERVLTAQVFFEDEFYWSDRLERGTSTAVIVPAGEIEVRWQWGSLGTQRVVLAPDEERELAWDGKP